MKLRYNIAMPARILSIKLAIPFDPTFMVSRPRLEAQLIRGLAAGHCLLLVTAPPGYGKTTLVSSWANRSEHHVCWLALDEGDNDPAQFWNETAHVLALSTVKTHVKNILMKLEAENRTSAVAHTRELKLL